MFSQFELAAQLRPLVDRKGPFPTSVIEYSDILQIEVDGHWYEVRVDEGNSVSVSHFHANRQEFLLQVDAKYLTIIQVAAILSAALKAARETRFPLAAKR